MKQIFWNTATHDDFKTADILDWIEGVGDISTYYEKRFVNVFGEILQQHDTAIRKDEREKTLNEMRDAIRNAKQYGSIEPEVMFHWTGIIAIIDSLRTQERQ